jgi:hypothetical protein
VIWRSQKLRKNLWFILILATVIFSAIAITILATRISGELVQKVKLTKKGKEGDVSSIIGESIKESTSIETILKDLSKEQKALETTSEVKERIIEFEKGITMEAPPKPQITTVDTIADLSDMLKIV